MKLTGKTKKGKERVKRDGSEGWIVVRTADKIACSNKSGPWFLMQNGDNEKSMRWVNMRDDEHFIVEE